MNRPDRWPAAAVHALTASGAVLGFFALVAAAHHQWETAFVWLGGALIIDGADGPLARRYDVAARLPRFSGESLDLIIDYLNYVIVPAVLIYEADLVPQGLAGVAAGAILLSSLYHFIDGASKTSDGYFVGFPAVWNVLALYAFVLPSPKIVVFAGIVLFAALTFVPLRWVHPVRVRSWRPVTAVITVAWSVAAIAALYRGFPGDLPTKIVFAVAALYFMALGLSRTALSHLRGRHGD